MEEAQLPRRGHILVFVHTSRRRVDPVGAAACTYLLKGSPLLTTNTPLFCVASDHLGAATSNAAPGRAAHCRHASPDGGDVCVGQATVAQFCSDWDTSCSDAGNIPQAWASADACVAQARNFPTGLEGATGGNSLACRIVSVAT